MPGGEIPVLSVAPAKALTPEELYTKKRAAAEKALADLGMCSSNFALSVIDVTRLEPMAIAAALMLLIEHGQCAPINASRAKQALNDYMMVWRHAPKGPAAA